MVLGEEEEKDNMGCRRAALLSAKGAGSTRATLIFPRTKKGVSPWGTGAPGKGTADHKIKLYRPAMPTISSSGPLFPEKQKERGRGGCSNTGNNTITANAVCGGYPQN
ncbi:hypothetical protein AVEN_143237-1 [Araneus ventricosus]|uniref:Uncharacterized protein n=1 Tax=Araneus ventricosus TaxID=182803 RepID=A0A4Y2ADH0_ARAVE|nr:hypothetical protein AVEN_143237-1 [Araneus ventricosus]